MPDSSVNLAVCPRCEHRWKPRGDPKLCAKCKLPFRDGPAPRWVEVPGYRCTRCEWTWLAHDDRPRPEFCARCKSAYWDREQIRK